MRDPCARILVSIVLSVAASCSDQGTGVEGPAGDVPPDVSTPIPLTGVPFRYLGFSGGLYPGQRNEPSPAHGAQGRAALAGVQPLDRQGRPDPAGKIVLVSVGMSNTTQEFCSTGAPPCEAWSFTGQAALDPAVDRTHLVIANGARGGQDALEWDDADDLNYDVVAEVRLPPLGVTDQQIQIAWVKQAIARPVSSLPDADADAYRLEAALGGIVRAMKARWPNLRIVFFSSRIYGGYAATSLNPEPYAYETAFAVRGVIEAQIEQSAGEGIDPEAGDVGLAGGAPWLAWGPYLWANGQEPRADGLAWLPEDFQEDGTHPSMLGEEKVGRLLLEFFKASPYSQCWFLARRSCQ